MELSAGAFELQLRSPGLGRFLDRRQGGLRSDRQLDRVLGHQVEEAGYAACATASSRNASTVARKLGTSGSWLISCRNRRPFGRPWVYQPVNLRSLWRAKVELSR